MKQKKSDAHSCGDYTKRILSRPEWTGTNKFFCLFITCTYTPEIDKKVILVLTFPGKCSLDKKTKTAWIVFYVYMNVLNRLYEVCGLFLLVALEEPTFLNAPCPATITDKIIDHFL